MYKLKRKLNFKYFDFKIYYISFDYFYERNNSIYVVLIYTIYKI